MKIAAHVILLVVSISSFQPATAQHSTPDSIKAVFINDALTPWKAYRTHLAICPCNK